MALTSADVAAHDDVLANDHNTLRSDLRDQDCDIQTRYFTVSPAAFVPQLDTQSFKIEPTYIQNNTDLTESWYRAGVNLPHGAIVTSFKAYWHRVDAAATGECDLVRSALTGITADVMATADSDASTGYHSVEDAIISDATIDNTAYTYSINMSLDPNDSATIDVKFLGVVITYTIVKGLP